MKSFPTETPSEQEEWRRRESNPRNVPYDQRAPAVAALDLERVGELLVRAVCASALCRHLRVRYTARDYLHPQTAEERFVADVLSDTPTDDLADRWFGGDAVGYGMRSAASSAAPLPEGESCVT